MRRPLSFSTAKRLPSQSGKYTASPSTVGVAETSLPVVNTHFGLRPLTLSGLIACSAAWFQVLFKFCPAIRHWRNAESSVPLCLSVSTCCADNLPANKSIIPNKTSTTLCSFIVPRSLDVLILTSKMSEGTLRGEVCCARLTVNQRNRRYPSL